MNLEKLIRRLSLVWLIFIVIVAFGGSAVLGYLTLKLAWFFYFGLMPWTDTITYATLLFIGWFVIYMILTVSQREWQFSKRQ